MPHLVPNAAPPMLSTEVGSTSTYLFGNDVLAHAEDPDIEMHIGRYRQALGRVVDSTDPDLQLIRDAIDRKYLEDNAGAQWGDFTSGMKEGDSITELLANSDDTTFMAFCLLNFLRQNRIHHAMLEHLPAQTADALARCDRLSDSGIITAGGHSLLTTAIEDIAENKLVMPLDSFEGATSLGLANPKGIWLSHMFDGGFAIGNPTDEYYQVAFHEDEHYAIASLYGVRPGKIQAVDEFLCEHHATISNPLPGAIELSVLDAAKTGGYQNLRLLFGYALIGPMTVDAEQLGDALTHDENGAAYAGLKTALHHNFNVLFPNYGGEAFETFLTQEDKCKYGHKADLLTGKWAVRAAIQLGITGDETIQTATA